MQLLFYVYLKILFISMTVSLKQDAADPLYFLPQYIDKLSH